MKTLGYKKQSITKPGVLEPKPLRSFENVYICIPTVDGRNPAPVDRRRIPFFIGFQPSKVVQDFSHPHYVPVIRAGNCR